MLTPAPVVVMGVLSQISTPAAGTLGFSYDGSLLLSHTWSGAVSGSVGQSYDNDFQITERCVNGSRCIAFDYDDDLLLTQAGDLTLTREAQKVGLVAGTSLGRINSSRSYNGFGEMSAYEAKDGSAQLYSSSYTRDQLGRITQHTETVEGDTTDLPLRVR